MCHGNPRSALASRRGLPHRTNHRVFDGLVRCAGDGDDPVQPGAAKQPDQDRPAAHHDNVYLSDFGISHSDAAAARMTATGQFLGTVAYMAPEQATGRVTGRSDQYSLACVAFELLSGVLPFPAP